MIQWKEDYSIGIPHIDGQHKRLFEIASGVFKLYRDEFCVDKYDRIVELMSELRDYTIYHFRTEEEYMEKTGHRKFFSHKMEHEDFIRKIDEVDLNMVDEDHDGYLLEILEFVVDWIDKHILEKDKLIGTDAV